VIKAFVFGKFLPFHKGHEAMINFALHESDFLSVLICCSDKENISGELRREWIQKTFESSKNIEVQVYRYNEDELPSKSETSREASRLWASVFKKIYPDYSLLVTSEPYGNMVAEFMNIRHIAFDLDRKRYPISATKIRVDVFAHWQYLPDSVKPSFAVKIIILGTESTGKTTLTHHLAEHYKCSSVLEVARDLIPNSNEFSLDDLQTVATAHAKKINEAVLGSSPMVIIDTDIHITKSYSRYTFHKDLAVGDDVYRASVANLYLYLNNDVDFFQDGTRLNESERNLLDRSHRQILSEHNVNIVEIRGNWEQRFNKAVEEIDRLIGKGHILL
jgi:HTH-type transcriptional repressor of NAD biosynthesis genes